MVSLVVLKDSKEDLKMHFQLADNLYAKAKVPPTEKVCLWLGVSDLLINGIILDLALCSVMLTLFSAR